MFTPFIRALEQLDDPAILRVLGASVLLSALCFALLCVFTAYGLHHALQGVAWLAWLVTMLGGLLVLVSGAWLFLPLAVVIASVFMEPVCRAVERRWYPGLPAARGANVAAQIWDSIVVGLLVLGLSAAGLVLALVIPGIGLALGWAITAWGLGRGVFVAVAMRRMGRIEAELVYRQHRGAVLIQGGLLALAGYVPLLNLLVPVLGSACMLHVLMRADQGAFWGEIRR